MNSVTEQAYAKINLYLDVVGRRPDGYHEIQSIMHTVTLADTVTVSLREGERSMTCSDLTLTCGADNLCLRAAEAFFDGLERNGGCLIHLEKRLPRKAGLGGGSADAAAVLRALNRLCDGPYSTEALLALGARVGADVPFCLVGGSALVTGIGERIEACPALPACYLVISGGIGHVSTPEAYRLIDSTAPSTQGNLDACLAALSEGSLSAIGQQLYNRFEDTLPTCRIVKAILQQAGALGTLMSGSGAAVFGLFEDRAGAEAAARRLREEGLTAEVTTPIR